MMVLQTAAARSRTVRGWGRRGPAAALEAVLWRWRVAWAAEVRTASLNGMRQAGAVGSHTACLACCCIIGI